MELCSGSHKKIDSDLVNEILGTSSYDNMCSVVSSIASKDYARVFKVINDIVVSSKDILVFSQTLRHSTVI